MSLRHDLLALTTADLADIANRGTVKRATKELDKNIVAYDITEEDGTITVAWADGPTSTIRAGETVSRGECDCAATGMCRHLIRAVLAYQRLHADAVAPEDAAAEPWSPGEVGDELLEELYSARRLSSLRRTFDDGLVVEVVKSSRPTARFHRLRHTVRFLVPGDLRYSQCDCSEEPPCRHAALAVWAFRLIGEEEAGIVTTGPGDDATDSSTPDEVEEAVRRIVETGVANVDSTTMDRLAALQGDLRREGVVWPAEILVDFQRQFDHYRARDARFSPELLADLVGELLIRFDALRSPVLPVPTLFVRGDADDRDARLGQSRLIGLGCGVRHQRRSVEILALMQDDSTGTVAAVTWHFSDPRSDEEREPEDLSRLGGKPVVKGRDLTTIGAGQLVIKTGELHADHRLALGRSTASVYAQNYAWEDLRPPVAASSYGEVRARLARLPPASLRPRRLGEDMHVVQVDRVEDARFSTREQAVRATLVDAGGEVAQLFHPYTSRNRHGTERLLNWLHRAPDGVRFVAGPHRLSAAGLVVSPTGIVFEVDGSRFLVQPWVDDMDAHLESSDVRIEPPTEDDAPLDVFRSELVAATGDALLVGVDEARAGGVARWDRLGRLATALGLVSIARVIDRLRQAIDDVDPHATSMALLEVAVLSRLAQELG